MKKQLFAAALVVAAISFTGCNTPTTGGDGKITGLSVSPKEIQLNENVTSAKLAAKLTPSDAKATVEWSSSDTTIATVTNKGYVEAMNYGECYIYAQVGDFKDSCHVVISTYLESIVFTGAIVFDVDTTLTLDTVTGKLRVDTIESSSGETYYCYPSMATVFVMTDGFYYNNSGRLDGAAVGTMLEIEAPMWYGSEYLNGEGKGVQFSLGRWVVADTVKAGRMHQTLPGEVDEKEYIAQMKKFVDSFNADPSSGDYAQYLKAAGEAFNGPSLTTFEYTTDETGEGGYSASYIPDAICEEALLYFGNSYSASRYMMSVDYGKVAFKGLAQDTVLGAHWGLNFGYDAATDQISLSDENVYFSKTIISEYGQMPEANAQKMEPMRINVLSEDPAMAASFLQQIKDKNIRVIRVKK